AQAKARRAPKGGGIVIGDRRALGAPEGPPGRAARQAPKASQGQDGEPRRQRLRARAPGTGMNLLRVLAYPVLVCGSLAAMQCGMRAGLADAGVVAVIALAALAVAALERAIPYRREWNVPRGDVLCDVLYAASSAVASEGARLATMALTLSAAAAL